MFSPLIPAAMFDVDGINAVIRVVSPHAGVIVTDAVRLVRMAIGQHHLVIAMGTDHAFIPHIQTVLGNAGMLGDAIGFPIGRCGSKLRLLGLHGIPAVVHTRPI